MKPCRMCDKDFEPRSRTQVFYSRSCASAFQHAVSPRPRTPGAYQLSAEDTGGEGGVRVAVPEGRARVVAAVVGTSCPAAGGWSPRRMRRLTMS